MLPSRFWSKVEGRQYPNGCWIWNGSRDQKGYGMFKTGSRTDGSARTQRAHRLAFEDAHGPIPDGLQLDHLCRTPSCVNPVHLEVVTSRENTLRGDTLASRLVRRTHCNHGHALTPDNIYIKPGTRARICRACTRRNG